MRCTLMHKRIAVAELELDEATGVIQKIYGVSAAEHLPVGVAVRGGTADRAALNGWWTDRVIPASRSGIREALSVLDLASTKELLIRSFGLSLSDQYWICPAGSGLTWDKINYFDNGFSDDIGDVLFGAGKKKTAFDFSSPDNTSDGNLKKRWKLIDGRRCLVKGGSNPFQQQPFNEVIASAVMDRLDIPHAAYTVLWSGGAPYSVCEDFVTGDTELVPAWRVIQTRKKSNSSSMYQHFVHCCKDLGAKNIVQSLDQMLVLDSIIANEDRHLNNFGLLRNAETLEWIGMAPIYDSGSSLGYDKTASQIRAGRDIICKPFKKRHEDQIRLVSSFDWIDFEGLADIKELVLEILSCGGASEFIDQNRRDAIADTASQRVQRLAQLAESGEAKRPVRVDSAEDDVEKDIAAAYSL